MICSKLAVNYGHPTSSVIAGGVITYTPTMRMCRKGVCLQNAALKFALQNTQFPMIDEILLF